MSNQERPNFENPEELNAPEQERMVRALRISTVFPDAVVLEKIGEKLRSKGVVTGFTIEPVRAGYVYGGSRVTEDQHLLGFLLDSQTPEEVCASIVAEISTEIGKHWDVPAIQQEELLINEKELSYIRRGDVEHAKYVDQKRKTLSISLAALMSLGGLIYEVTQRYAQSREDQAVHSERLRSYEELSALQEKIQEQVLALDLQLQNKEPLHVAPNDMAANDSYVETYQILESVRDVEDKMRRLAKSETK